MGVHHPGCSILGNQLACQIDVARAGVGRALLQVGVQQLSALAVDAGAVGGLWDADGVDSSAQSVVAVAGYPAHQEQPLAQVKVVALCAFGCGVALGVVAEAGI